MRRLAEPQDLLLHFAEPREAELDCEIVASNHDRRRIVRRRLQNELRQIARRERRLDLQHKPRRLALGAARDEMILQEFDVVDPLYERVADQVGVLGDEIEGGRSSSVGEKLTPLPGFGRTPISRAAEILISA
jgi:hypothetical protein